MQENRTTAELAAAELAAAKDLHIGCILRAIDRPNHVRESLWTPSRSVEQRRRMMRGRCARGRRELQR